jgi:hypothetical protein
MRMGHDHHHATGSEGALKGALVLTTAFLLVETIGGLWSGSLALLSDAAHMFTDTAALAIAVAAVRIGRRPADSERTFGYYRFEILAAAFNAILLLLVAVYWRPWPRKTALSSPKNRVFRPPPTGPARARGAASSAWRAAKRQERTQGLDRLSAGH